MRFSMGSNCVLSQSACARRAESSASGVAVPQNAAYAPPKGVALYGQPPKGMAPYGKPDQGRYSPGGEAVREGVSPSPARPKTSESWHVQHLLVRTSVNARTPAVQALRGER